MDPAHAHTPLPVIHVHGFEPFAITIYILSASVSLLAFLYGLFIVYLDRTVWKNHIVRVIVVVQIINSLRFILRVVGSFIPIYSDFGCRVLLFLNNALIILPVNLCVYCVVYLQVLIIYQVSPYKRWPKITFMVLAVLTSVIPPASFLYVSHNKAGLVSYCDLPLIYPRRFYVFYMLVSALWQYLSGVIGVISATIIIIYIVRARRASRRIEERSVYSYGLSRSMSQQTRSNVLYRTLITIIWYPITPIVSQWMNLILYSVSYYKHRTYTWLEFINVLLLGLQSVLLAIGLVVYPTIQKTFKHKVWDRWVRPKERMETTSDVTSGNEYLPGQGLPHLDRSGIFIVDSVSSDSISDFEERQQSLRFPRKSRGSSIGDQI
ncbi:hypothetical protein EV175_001869 [Coemansia sp. RSA 1933]|nr:hypothetical protein EV175_001869 [Coemansia sp. RSA 1933]